MKSSCSRIVITLLLTLPTLSSCSSNSFAQHALGNYNKKNSLLLSNYKNTPADLAELDNLKAVANNAYEALSPEEIAKSQHCNECAKNSLTQAQCAISNCRAVNSKLLRKYQNSSVDLAILDTCKKRVTTALEQLSIEEQAKIVSQYPEYAKLLNNPNLQS
jgi:hypothetical protein